MSLIKSGIIVSLFTLLSRLLGFVRDTLVASHLGTGVYADVNNIAMRFPNFFRSLFAEGAFNPAFVPLFSEKLNKEGQSSALNFANKIFTWLMLILLIFTILIEIIMPSVMHVFAPGFSTNLEKFRLTVLLSRITFPYLILISAVSCISCILNAMGRFAASSASSIILNICQIVTIIAFSASNHIVYALSFSVLIAGICQFFAIYYSARKIKVMVKIVQPELDLDVKKLLKKMLPAIIGSSALQINAVVSSVIATLIPGAVSTLYYAERLTQLPLALIGTAIGTVLLPHLTKQFSSNNFLQANINQNRALEICLLFSLPATFALITLSHPLIHLLFYRGAFTTQDNIAVAAALVAFSCGLPAFVLNKIFTPCFFAMQDTKTPVKISVICMIVNIVLNLILMRFFGFVGIAYANSIAAWLNTVLLVLVLIKRKLFSFEPKLKHKVTGLIFSSLLMTSYLLFTAYRLDELIYGEDTTYKLLSFLLIIGGGIIIYFLIAYLTKAINLSELRQILSTR